MEDIVNIQTTTFGHPPSSSTHDKKSLMHSILDEGFNELFRSR